jgi:hypothetical protein
MAESSITIAYLWTHAYRCESGMSGVCPPSYYVSLFLFPLRSLVICVRDQRRREDNDKGKEEGGDKMYVQSFKLSYGNPFSLPRIHFLIG